MMKTIKLVFAILLAMFAISQANAQCGPCEDWIVENRTNCDIDLLWYGVSCSPPCTAAVSAGILPANTPPTTLSAPCVQVGDCGYVCPTALVVWDLPNFDFPIPAYGPLHHMHVKTCSSCPTGYMKATYTPGTTHTVVFECE